MKNRACLREYAGDCVDRRVLWRLIAPASHPLIVWSDRPDSDQHPGIAEINRSSEQDHIFGYVRSQRRWRSFTRDAREVDVLRVDQFQVGSVMVKNLLCELTVFEDGAPSFLIGSYPLSPIPLAMP